VFCTVCAAANPIAAARCAVCGAGFAPRIRRVPAVASVASRRWRLGPRPGESARPSSARGVVLRLLYLLPILALLSGGATAAARYRADRVALAERYAAAVAAATAGRHPEAAAGFAALPGYRDADARRAAALAAVAPYRDAYLDGVAALDAGRFDEAIARLLPVARDLPGYEDAVARLADARRLRADVLRREADAAETRRDWPAAERALAALLAVDPGDGDAAARLEALRREHAPLVLARDQTLYLVGPDGADERLLSDAVPAAWPAWSPDRSRVAFLSPAPDPADGGPTGGARGIDVALYVVNADGSGLTRLADRLSSHTAPVWSPDGARLAYTSYADFDQDREQGRIGVRVVDVATGRETELTADLPIAFNPTWSPTGDRLAFVAKREPRGEPNLTNVPGDVHVHSFVTGARANLSEGKIKDAWSLAWSPADERIIVFTVFGQAWYEPSQTGLRLLDAGSGAVEKIETESAQPLAPVWSPDGARYAFVDGDQTVRVRSAAGEEAAVEVADPLSGEIAWSPAGDALIAASLEPADPSVLLRLGPGAPTPTELPLVFDFDNVSVGTPQWAPLRNPPVAGPPSIGGTGLDHP
jgi:tetratricopeptide (TPR) repeat protein